MSVKAFAIDTAKLAPPALATFLGWVGVHIPEIIQFCMLIYAVGLAVQTFYRFFSWLRSKFASLRTPPSP